jgi:nickel transport protein
MREISYLWKKSRLALFIQGLVLLLIVGAAATPALAHRVLVFAFTEGDTVRTESKFVPNTPVKQGKVIVQDAKSGKELLTGQTDDQGKFSFPMPAEAKSQKMDLKIIIEAAMGHRGEFLLKAR